MTNKFRALCSELIDIITAHANPDDYAVGYVAEMLTRARAALADEPAAPAPPVDGEVAELVAWLQEEAEELWRIGSEDSQELWRIACEDSAPKIARAAELLQRHALVPVAVSERMPGPEDCDAEGRCWLYYMTMSKASQWSLRVRSEILEAAYSYWLPAHALPLPEVGE